MIRKRSWTNSGVCGKPFIPKALALYGLAVAVAPAIGPVLGGYITDHASWHKGLARGQIPNLEDLVIGGRDELAAVLAVVLSLSPLTLSFSRPASARGCGHFASQSPPGELAGRRDA
ncbi:MAG: hypothetical protein ACLP1W_06695 [Rhodomicrobium sp.]